MNRRNERIEPLNAAFASFIRRKRIELNLLQTEVAQYLGISQEHYSDLERGIYRITLTDFVRFVKKYCPDFKMDLPKEVSKKIYIMLTSIGSILASLTRHDLTPKHPMLYLP